MIRNSSRKHSNAGSPSSPLTIHDLPQRFDSWRLDRLYGSLGIRSTRAQFYQMDSHQQEVEETGMYALSELQASSQV